MQSTAGLHGSLKTSLALAGVSLLAGLAGCGGMADAPDGGSTDAPLPPVWPTSVTTTSCEQYESVSVGNYVISSNYWNKTTCPGEQCIEINTANGAFSVYKVAEPCGNNVSSFPNILYGCAYGVCSPGTILPLPVSAVTNLKTSWDISVGGARNDRWNAAYDIWFCPDKNCGAAGFPKGLELMVWLDVKNAGGWKDHLGTTNLAGYKWDVWYADMAAGGATDSWGYMDYIAQPANLTSVKDLDLLALVKDALNRGYVKSDWYLYAVQAGFEVRTGGVPYTSNSFSVTVNDVTASNQPLPYSGPSCDGGVPVAQQGLMSVQDNYVTAGPLHGYGNSWTWVGADSKAIACSTPVCTGIPEWGQAVSCSPPLGPTAVCTAGTITADKTYNSVAGVGFALNQDKAVAVDGGVAVDSGAAGTAGVDAGGPVGTITIPHTIAITVERSGDKMGGNLSLRAQLTAANGDLYCYGGSLNDAIPVTKFNTKCWNNTGVYATASTPFTKLDIIVPSSAASDLEFSYCIANVVVQ
jgi:hypothetical protein